MSNPLYQELGNRQQPNIMSQFQQFVQSMKGKDPNEEISRLLQSGQISQDQLNQAQQMAQQMRSLFGNMK